MNLMSPKLPNHTKGKDARKEKGEEKKIAIATISFYMIGR